MIGGRAMAGLLAALLLAAPTWARRPTPVQIPGVGFLPDAPPRTGAGDGLCAAYRGALPEERGLVSSGEPENVSDSLSPLINDLLERPGRADFSLASLLDLSNGFVSMMGEHLAVGDFSGLACGEGCPFYPAGFAGAQPTYFGGRYRGFLNVPEAWTGKSLYVGMRADDGAYLKIFDRRGQDNVLVMTSGP